MAWDIFLWLENEAKLPLESSNWKFMKQNQLIPVYQKNLSKSEHDNFTSELEKITSN